MSTTSTQYYYGNYRFHSRHPWSVRTLEVSLTEMHKVDEEERSSVRQRLASDYGFTGLSILNRFFNLYKFDILKDTVFDSMHTLLLCIVKRHLDHYASCNLLSDSL